MSPIEIGSETGDGFLSLKPNCHLLDIIFLVTGPVRIFSVVDVKAFGRFGVEAVSGPKESNEHFVVVQRVDFGYIEVVISPTEINEYLLVGVEGVE